MLPQRKYWINRWRFVTVHYKLYRSNVIYRIFLGKLIIIKKLVIIDPTLPQNDVLINVINFLVN